MRRTYVGVHPYGLVCNSKVYVSRFVKAGSVDALATPAAVNRLMLPQHSHRHLLE